MHQILKVEMGEFQISAPFSEANFCMFDPVARKLVIYGFSPHLLIRRRITNEDSGYSFVYTFFLFLYISVCCGKNCPSSHDVLNTLCLMA